jgi:hypothetical protein
MKEFVFHYRKTKGIPNLESISLYNVQNYIPIYGKFFDINENNFNSIQLNQRYYVQSVLGKCGGTVEDPPSYCSMELYSPPSPAASPSPIDDHCIECIVSDDAGELCNVPVFVKYSPLLDPVKYLSGKYNLSGKWSALPTFQSTTSEESCNEKMLDKNNAAYVDGFFSYLTSQLLHNHGVVHGLDYYGSYLCIQSKFHINIFDDIEYLSNSTFFNNNREERFTLDCPFDESTMNADTRSKRKRLSTIEDDETLQIDVDTLPPISEASCILASDDVLQNCLNDIGMELTSSASVPSKRNSSNSSKTCSSRSSDTQQTTSLASGHSASSSSSCSSSSSLSDASSLHADDVNEDDEDVVVEWKKGEHSNHEDNDCEKNENEDGDDDDDEDGSWTDDDEQVIAKIMDFPVQAIFLEKCKNTLDSLMMDDELTRDEWISILFQVVMTLTIYQKMFHFTHNDLHTNNIMYVETEEEYIYYVYNEQRYKVPTYGRIFKIIDFGRSIYHFRGQLICSDSFHINGDASSQYNMEPYFNPNKPILEANYSFDLCRLACSLFDYFVNDIRKVDKICAKDDIVALVVKWIKDDKGRNVLYKSNGEERYSDFKLYKMIARTVHNGVPSEQIKESLFQNYRITEKKYKKLSKRKTLLINVDDLPCYV